MAQAMTPSGNTPVDRVLNALTAAGCNPRGSPPQFTSRCPVSAAHKGGDKNPSMSLKESPEGKALIYCHAGCTTPQIAEALGLRMADLFPEKPPKVAEIGPAGRWRATYPYHDADGELLFEVVRFDNAGNKTFRQRRPTSNGKWEWNTNGVVKVLYHLPQVLRAVASGETIVIVEGEKDAENVPWAFGITATCNPGGAGKWESIHTDAVAGCSRVVVIADDDRPGRSHAAAVLRALEGRVGEVRAVLPAEGCKDITEHLKAGHGKDRLRPVTLAELDYIDGEPEAPSEPASLPLAHVVVWTDFWNADYSGDDWLAEPLIPRGRLIALYAPAKAGKSSAILALVAALATGKPIFGYWPCQPVSVLYLDYEMTGADLQERLVELGYGPADDLANLHYAVLPSLPPLDTAEGAQAVLELATYFDAQLIVVDTFGRAVEGPENEADTVRAFYRHTGSTLKGEGRSVLRADHSGQDLTKGQRGSSAKADDVDVVWQLTRTQGGAALLRTHSRLAWVPDKVNLSRTETDDGVTWGVAIAKETYKPGTDVIAALLDTLGVSATATVNDAVVALRKAGTPKRKGAVGDAQRWRREIEMSRFGAGTDPGNRPSRNTPEPTPEPTVPSLVEPHGNRPEPSPEATWEPQTVTSKEPSGTQPEIEMF